jgi:ribulose 1,5-bisphosphate carboxylase large subunit-like protein
VASGPLIGTIVKPSVGLSPRDGGHRAQLLAGGIDFIKDDELQADGPHCPFDERVRAVMRVVHAAASARPPGHGGLQPHRRGRRDEAPARPGAGRAAAA